MKAIAKLKMLTLLAFLTLSLPVFSNTIENNDPDPGKTLVTNTTTEAEKAKAEADKARADVLLKRLEEIKEMDKSNLTRVEKRALRKEVRAIKAEMKTLGHGVYLSVGAIIIIILLLILLL